MAKADPFGFVGHGFKLSAHIFGDGLKSSGNPEALWFAKLNQVRPHSEAQNPSSFVFAPDLVNAPDEFTKR
jgi:hypothetical protein